MLWFLFAVTSLSPMCNGSFFQIPFFHKLFQKIHKFSLTNAVIYYWDHLSSQAPHAQSAVSLQKNTTTNWSVVSQNNCVVHRETHTLTQKAGHIMHSTLQVIHRALTVHSTTPHLPGTHVLPTLLFITHLD